MKHLTNYLFVAILFLTLKTESSSAALFDLQFAYNATDSIPNQPTGMAAVLQIGNDIWVSRWASDTLYRFNKSGQLLQTFTVAGLTGVRSLTWGGSYIYAANNTDTIYRINPATKQLAPPHIATPVTQVRWCTYDSTAAGGAGGFWIGNFNTDITQVNLSGTTINTIPAATHTITGMYGAAIDHVTSGGPYLWLFAQTLPNNATFVSVNLNTGLPTGQSHDVSQHVTVTSPLAGGMCITKEMVSGKNTLMGLLQATPNYIIGLELSDPAATDAELTSFRSVDGYTQIPLSQNKPVSFSGIITNQGIGTIDTPMLKIEVMSGGNIIWSDSTTGSAIIGGATSNLSVSGFTPPGKGDYTAMGYVKTVGQTDISAANDTMTFSFAVTDSTFARDNNIPTGNPYTVSSTDWAYATVNFELTNDDTLTSIWVRLETPATGDTTYAVIASTTSGVPNSVIATGIPVIINSLTNEYVLPLSAPLALPAGTYAFGCYEGVNVGIGLSQSNSYYTSGTNYYFVAGSWSASGIQTARFIRPNFYHEEMTVSVAESLNNNEFALYPNPANNYINMRFKFDEARDIEVSIINSLGVVVNEEKYHQVQDDIMELDLSRLENGVYFININKEGGERLTRKVLLAK